MGMALSLGRRGLGRVWPNPNVGCVVVKDGRVIGRGWTADGGRPHAEPQALDGIDARGATAYVTLEPCAHHGKTPPCSEALIAAGVARVVIAAGDPDPRVAGKGIAMLRAAGITVDTGVREDEARSDMAGFLLRITQNRPFVTLKLASSFDGRIATASGESKWITGPDARRAVHAMRARHDAVLVGAGTVRADDPTLTVRDIGVTHQPGRVVASRKLDITATNLLNTQDIAPLWLCHGPDASVGEWADRGAKPIACTAQGRQIDPLDMMQKLASAGLTRVFCEGGGSLAASLLGAGLVDELVGFTAGVTLGAEGTPSIGAMGIESLAEAPRFSLIETRQLGADALHRWVRS
ncbi:bifunctional diaminohydroxyphosphoribosylaminopyrimidine deaminase/5-amino-6-(5-phosphoribosylamino)uracil reductase RibD [Octadecabacter sp. CECT 8868]|uniref:bifunctional diaminohydroxyphosphoribosylaminopyrimidine deaminase/5-amino-6-(5-phosphoribosylamino)uracil reductase RibD n=1 Tax=Octadecabacter algicola TaxID=2909342 RepID=UPI001EEE107F|nr:bifunctional diaminohydroxyphosphoribosylaminopyrimidine deaminase/5-amino-6-(5-phosphoribosylamino)uracil reductase RibD [Octadecabacter algicola]MCF2904540.1 bifunctional diaminohydroxyphosphoribosylaminopyrimidine deaminase/5-amino-6-(5-phosphoribosylamino)uracil reductase RibD [Octadecabacter algicola]